MKSALPFLLIAVSTIFPLNQGGKNYEHRDTPEADPPANSFSSPWQRTPNLEELKFVSQIPAYIPPRISGFAYDGERFWAAIYHGKGSYAIFDPLTLDWKISEKTECHKAIKQVSEPFGSPGGICFVGDRLWVVGSYGESFGSVNMQDWKVEKLFKRRHRDDQGASQSYFGVTYDGNHLWIAWHWFKYKLPVSETQLLLKVDPETGEVIAEYPIPAGTRNDATHGLTWDGNNLWHMKDSTLSAIDRSTGQVIAQYTLQAIKRPSGLAWDQESLWIVEFDGKVWRLPFLTWRPLSG